MGAYAEGLGRNMSRRCLGPQKLFLVDKSVELSKCSAFKRHGDDVVTSEKVGVRADATLEHRSNLTPRQTNAINTFQKELNCS